MPEGMFVFQCVALPFVPLTQVAPKEWEYLSSRHPSSLISFLTVAAIMVCRQLVIGELWWRLMNHCSFATGHEVTTDASYRELWRTNSLRHYHYVPQLLRIVALDSGVVLSAETQIPWLQV